MSDDKEEDKLPHEQDDAKLARKRRYEQRRRAYLSDRGVDGRNRVDDMAKMWGTDPLLELLKAGRR